MKLSSRPIRVIGTTVAIGLAFAVLAVASPAQAAQIGTLTFNSLTSQDSAFTMTTSGACPDGATNFLVKLEGGNIPVPSSAPNLLGNTSGGTIAGGINSVAFTATASTTLANFALGNGTTLADATYTATLVCRTALQNASLGDYVGTFVLSNGGATVTPQVPVVAVDTTTTITTLPATNAGSGAPVTIRAQVTADSGSAAATGTVQFKDGGSALGSPVTVNSAGLATLTVADLDLGGHTLSADYTPSTAAFKASSTTSSASLVIGLTGPSNVRPATLSGTVKVGGKVVCNAGTWAGATTYTYAFLKDGAVVQGPGSDYDLVLSASDYNKALACRVAGINPEGSAVRHHHRGEGRTRLCRDAVQEAADPLLGDRCQRR